MKQRPKPPKNNMRPLEGRKRVIIAGSRNTHAVSRQWVFDHLDRLLGRLKDPIILSGGAAGIDKLGEIWAGWNWCLLRVYRPDYKIHPPKIAPLKRNALMASEADACVCFWDGESRGTLNMITEARKAGLKTKVIRLPNGNEND